MAKIKTLDELIDLYKNDPTKLVRVEDIGPLIQTSIQQVAPPCCVGYKRYIAILDQSGTNDPTVIVLLNELQGTIVWTRVNTGEYQGTLIHAFPNGKTQVFLGNSWAAGQTVNYPLFGGYRSTSNIINVSTSVDNSGTISLSDDILVQTAIEIRVFL